MPFDSTLIRSMIADSSLEAEEKVAAETLLGNVITQWEYLNACQISDNFALEDIDASASTDSGFDAWFSVVYDNISIVFSASIGYDSETKTYRPKIELFGNESSTAVYEFTIVHKESVRLSGLLEAIELCKNDLGEARVLAFNWLDSVAPNEVC